MSEANAPTSYMALESVQRYRLRPPLSHFFAWISLHGFASTLTSNNSSTSAIVSLCLFMMVLYINGISTNNDKSIKLMLYFHQLFAIAEMACLLAYMKIPDKEMVKLGFSLSLSQSFGTKSMPICLRAESSLNPWPLAPELIAEQSRANHPDERYSKNAKQNHYPQ